MIRFRDSVWRQLLALMLVLVLGMAMLWWQVPSLRVWGHSLRLTFNRWPKTTVVADMTAARDPAVLTVLAGHVRDRDVLTPQEQLAWPEFRGATFGEFCLWRIRELAYDLDMSGDRYENAQNFRDFQLWLDEHKESLVWDEDAGAFLLSEEQP